MSKARNWWLGLALALLACGGPLWAADEPASYSEDYLRHFCDQVAVYAAFSMRARQEWLSKESAELLGAPFAARTP
ncbi:MAG: hypothetical protein ACOC00_08655 [Halothiobacillaceae bacterium]